MRDTSTRFIGCPFGFSAVAKPVYLTTGEKHWRICLSYKENEHNHELSLLHHMSLAENRKIVNTEELQMSIHTWNKFHDPTRAAGEIRQSRDG